MWVMVGLLGHTCCHNVLCHTIRTCHMPMCCECPLHRAAQPQRACHPAIHCCGSQPLFTEQKTRAAPHASLHAADDIPRGSHCGCLLLVLLLLLLLRAGRTAAQELFSKPRPLASAYLWQQQRQQHRQANMSAILVCCGRDSCHIAGDECAAVSVMS